MRRRSAPSAVRTRTSQLSRLAPPGSGRTPVTAASVPHSSCSRDASALASPEASVMTRPPTRLQRLPPSPGHTIHGTGPDRQAQAPRPGGDRECHSFGWCLVFKGKHQAEGKLMRVFVTGATGALGRHLVPGLIAAGHEVTATTRAPGKVAQLREAGAAPVILDGLDREAVITAVRAAMPEVIVHQMTALAGMRSFRNPDKLFAATNELRTRGTDNLLAAAARAGTRRVIAQG